MFLHGHGYSKDFPPDAGNGVRWATVVIFDGPVEKMGKDNEHGLVEDRVVPQKPRNACVLSGIVRANVPARGERISMKTADFSRQGFFGRIC